MNYINNDDSHKITEIHMLSNTKNYFSWKKKNKQKTKNSGLQLNGLAF